MIRSPPPPPPLCSRPVISLRGNRHRPDESHFLRPPQLVLEGALMVLRNTPSTAGNSMTSSERPSPEPKRRPQPYWGGDNYGNALEASNALNYRVWGIPAVLSREIPGNALRAFPGSFRNFSGISSGKSQPYWGCGPGTFPPPQKKKIARYVLPPPPFERGQTVKN